MVLRPGWGNATVSAPRYCRGDGEGARTRVSLWKQLCFVSWVAAILQEHLHAKKTFVSPDLLFLLIS